MNRPQTVALIGSAIAPAHRDWKNELISMHEHEHHTLSFLTPKPPPAIELSIPHLHLLRAHELELAGQADIVVWYHMDGEWKESTNLYYDQLIARSKLLIVWISPEQTETIDDDDLPATYHVVPYKGPLAGVIALLDYFTAVQPVQSRSLVLERKKHENTNLVATTDVEPI